MSGAAGWVLPPEAQLGGLAVIDYLISLFEARAEMEAPGAGMPAADVVKVLRLVRVDRDLFDPLVTAVPDRNMQAVIGEGGLVS
jgi:hypothetical protein